MIHKLLDNQIDIDAINQQIQELESIFECEIPDEFAAFHRSKNVSFDPVISFINDTIKIADPTWVPSENYEYSPYEIVDKEKNSFVFCTIQINGKTENVGIGEFLSLEMNLKYLMKGDDFSDLMMEEKILLVSYHYSSLYWCVGLAGERKGQVFFWDSFGSILYFGYNTFDEFLHSIKIGIEVDKT